MEKLRSLITTIGESFRFKGPHEKTALPSSQLRAPVSTLFLRMSVKEQVLFAKRLSFLVKAGVSIVEGMTMIRNQTRSKRMQRVYNDIITDITAGMFLSSSLEKYRHLFGDFTVNLIRVGENAGALSENLAYLAEELSKKHALQRKVYGALIYPIFITIATLGVTSLLIVFIFPKIMPIFVSLDIELPLTTRILLWVSEYLAEYGLVTALGLILLIGVVEVLRRTIRPVRILFDWILLKLPIAGSIARSYNCANFCRTLGLNIRSGITLSESMLITAHVTGNILYREAYLEFASRIVKGQKISTAMAAYPSLFPDMLPHMILIGETTGSLSNTLGYLSDLHEAEVDETTKNLSNSIEPILLMTMGILVGLIAVSVITPIYDITKSLGNR